MLTFNLRFIVDATMLFLQPTFCASNGRKALFLRIRERFDLQEQRVPKRSRQSYQFMNNDRSRQLLIRMCQRWAPQNPSIYDPMTSFLVGLSQPFFTYFLIF